MSRGCLGFFWGVQTRASGGLDAFFALVIYLAGLTAVTTGMLKRNDDRVMVSMSDWKCCLCLRRLKNERGVRGQFSYRQLRIQELVFDSVELTGYPRFSMN